MESNFLTPVKLWEDFNPKQDPLKVSIIENIEVNGFPTRSLFFTALHDGNGEIRAYAKIVSPPTSIQNQKRNKQKFILYIPDIKEGQDIDEKLRDFASRDYTVAVVDLLGSGERHTLYPESFAYGKYVNAKRNLHNCTPNATASPMFLWAKILRRFLSVVEEYYPNVKPVCVAERAGNELLWPLVAFDTRIYGGLSILGSGFGSFLGFNKPTIKENDDNAHKWEMALSPQSYVKFTACPILIVTCANNDSGEFDKLDNLVRLLPEQSLCSTIVSNRLSKQISETSYASMWRWLEGRYSAKKELPKSPDLTYGVENGKLVITVSPDESEKKVSMVSVYYSYDEPNPEYRNWHTIKGKNETDYKFNITVSEHDKEIYTYANVQYRDNVEIASTPIKIGLDNLKTITRRRITPNKLLFDTSKENDFFAETDDVVLKDFTCMKEELESGLSGICVRKGKLVSFNVNEQRTLNANGMLQMSVYTITERNIIIRLTTLEDGKYKRYDAKAYIPAGFDWQKLKFDADDFRDDKQIGMDGWNNLKKIEIINAEGILFNNMLWV